MAELVGTYKDEEEVRRVWDYGSPQFRRNWIEREIRVRLMIRRASRHDHYGSSRWRGIRGVNPPSLKDPYSIEEVKKVESEVTEEDGFRCFLRFIKAAVRDHSPGFRNPLAPPVPMWR